MHHTGSQENEVGPEVGGDPGAETSGRIRAGRRAAGVPGP